VNKDKQARLEAQGWRVGSAEDFLRQKPRLARNAQHRLGDDVGARGEHAKAKLGPLLTLPSAGRAIIDPVKLHG
jgi:hypothetical protein